MGSRAAAGAQASGRHGEVFHEGCCVQGDREVAVEDVPDARVERDDDVVVRVTSSALCRTDLHMYDGRTGAVPGMVLGHAGLGTVETSAGPCAA